ncbi:hypothetical protein C8R43DRAFT_673963 [Mycena crocata]|nr:hypothetical protein C8R43DRAFT_673963 [Mycena crocata]
MTSHPPLSAPALPPDLEREIFQTSALTRPSAIPILMLVAWRVKTWVEPLLYRTIVLHEKRERDDGGTEAISLPHPHRQTILDLMQSRPAEVFAQNVRNLLLGPGDDAQNKLFLSACPNIQNLWISSACLDSEDRLLPAIEGLPLKHLYCHLTNLFGSQLDIKFTHPIFSQITHLELFDRFFYSDAILPGVWANQALIPNLTHLAFSEHILFPVCPTWLKSCTSLRVLVALVNIELFSNADMHVAALGSDLVEDPRFVVMECRLYMRDWELGAYTGVDYWSRAEDFVEKRKSGEIPRREFHLRDIPNKERH